VVLASFEVTIPGFLWRN